MKKKNHFGNTFGKYRFAAVVGLFILCVGMIVPITGSAQSKATNVNVVNTPNVSIINSTATPVPVVSVPMLPFQEEVTITIPDGSTGNSEGFDVPAGKRLVIEYVSGNGGLSDGQQITEIRIDVLGILGGTVKGHYFAASHQASVPGLGEYFVIGQQTRLYAVGNVGFYAFRSDTAGIGVVKISVSGYLIDQ